MFNKEQREEFEVLVSKLSDFMKANAHPHCCVVVTSTEGILWEGLETVQTAAKD